MRFLFSFVLFLGLSDVSQAFEFETLDAGQATTDICLPVPPQMVDAVEEALRQDERDAKAEIEIAQNAAEAMSDLLEMSPRVLPDWNNLNTNFIQSNMALSNTAREKAEDICLLTDLALAYTQANEAKITLLLLQANNTLAAGKYGEAYDKAFDAKQLAEQSKALMEFGADCAIDDLFDILFTPEIGGAIPLIP